MGVAERARRQPGQLPGVPVGEGDHHPVRGERVQTGERVGREARLALLPIGDHWRAGRLELPDGLAYRRVGQLGVGFRGDPAGGEVAAGLDQLWWPGDAPDRLGGDGHDLTAL